MFVGSAETTLTFRVKTPVVKPDSDTLILPKLDVGDLEYLQKMWYVWKRDFKHANKHSYIRETLTIVQLLCNSNYLPYPNVAFYSGVPKHQLPGRKIKGIYFLGSKEIEIYYDNISDFHDMFNVVVHEWLHHFYNIKKIEDMVDYETQKHKPEFYTVLNKLINRIEFCDLLWNHRKIDCDY